MAALRKAGVPVLDLSADFRLHDPAVYREWYGEHPAPELLPAAVYGLPELHREALRKAELVAVPGCYPTSALLPLAPFLRERLVETSGIVVDSKSGVSGAGRKLEAGYLFAEQAENCLAYKPGHAHRHAPEMEQEASEVAGAQVTLSFVPHLLPVIRGIVTSVYVRPRARLSAARGPRGAHARVRKRALRARAAAGRDAQPGRPCAAATSATWRPSQTSATAR